MRDPQGWLGLIFGGGFLGLVGGLLTMRDRRQTRYDTMRDTDMERLRKRNDYLESENDRLRAAFSDRGIDPDNIPAVQR